MILTAETERCKAVKDIQNNRGTSSTIVHGFVDSCYTERFCWCVRTQARKSRRGSGEGQVQEDVALQ